MKKTTFMLLLVCTAFLPVWAQQALDASGGSISLNNNLIVDYSVGEVVTATTGTPSSTNYYTAGVIQPVHGVTPSSDRLGEQFYLKVFPNPVSHLLAIETNFQGFRHFRFTDVQGRIISKGNFEYAPMDLSWMATGTYFLTLSSSDQISETIKIVKQ